MKRYTNCLPIVISQCDFYIYFTAFDILPENPHLTAMVEPFYNRSLGVVFHFEIAYNLRYHLAIVL